MRCGHSHSVQSDTKIFFSGSSEPRRNGRQHANNPAQGRPHPQQAPRRGNLGSHGPNQVGTPQAHMDRAAPCRQVGSRQWSGGSRNVAVSPPEHGYRFLSILSAAWWFRAMRVFPSRTVHSGRVALLEGGASEYERPNRQSTRSGCPCPHVETVAGVARRSRSTSPSATAVS